MLQVREAALDRARLLNRLTLGWNVAEGVIAIAAGVAASSVSLIGFGLDSGIEVSASVILAWRLHQERRGGCMAENDRLATRLIAGSFLALAVYVWVTGTGDLLAGSEPEPTLLGVLLAGASVAVMPSLARAKRRLAVPLGSSAAASEAAQTMFCAVLSGVVLVGLALNLLLGWWWADPVAALLIGALAMREAALVWRAHSLEDTCCA
ncbi:MAG TPA: cation transporter [Acidimicrobiales bacterium]|nr:cation transporter [Acidimicrobiales bacterium]